MFHLNFNIVFIFHSVFEYFELKLSNRTKQNFFSMKCFVILNGTFLNEL